MCIFTLLRVFSSKVDCPCSIELLLETASSYNAEQVSGLLTGPCNEDKKIMQKSCNWTSTFCDYGGRFHDYKDEQCARASVHNQSGCIHAHLIRESGS